MKPTLKRKDRVQVQSKVYARLPDGGLASAPAHTCGRIIDFFPQFCDVTENNPVVVETIAIVRLDVRRGETLDVCINERALLRVPRSRSRSRTARRPSRA